MENSRSEPARASRAGPLDRPGVLAAALVVALGLPAALRAQGAAEGATSPTTGAEASPPTTSAAPSIPTTPLIELLEAARAEVERPDSGPEETRIWEFLTQVTRRPDAPPGQTVAEQREAVRKLESELAARLAGEGEKVRPEMLRARAGQLEQLRALREQRVAHLAALDADLHWFQEQRGRAERGEADDAIPGDLFERGIEEGEARFRAARARGQEALDLVERWIQVQEKELDLARKVQTVADEDIEEIRTELKAAEEEVSRERERAAADLQQALEEERSAAEELGRLEEQLERTQDERVARVLRLKGDLGEERRSAASERVQLARARQELARARALRRKDELEYLYALKELDERVYTAAELQALRREVAERMADIQRELAAVEARLEGARALLDELRARRRTYQTSEEDLLSPDLPKEKRGAAWVLRQVFAKLDEREEAAEELRDVRKEILAVHAQRRTDEEALRAAVEGRLQALQRRGLPSQATVLRHVRALGTDLRRGIARGAPGRLAGLVGGRAVAALTRPDLAALIPQLLLALLVLLGTRRVLGALEASLSEAERERAAARGEDLGARPGEGEGPEEHEGEEEADG